MLLDFSEQELQSIIEALADEKVATMVSTKIEERRAQINKNRTKLLKRKVLRKEFLKMSANKLREDFLLNITESELLFKEVLNNLNVDYKFQEIFYLSDREYYIADFYLPDYDTIFEIGCFKDKHGKTRVMDESRSAKLLEIGIKNIYRIENTEVLNDMLLLKEKVKALLEL